MTELYNDINLGRITDWDIEDSSYPQTDINEMSWYVHDRETLVSCINTRISKYSLKFLLDRVKDDYDETLWKDVLKSLINRYHLNALKVILGESFEFEYNLKVDTENLIKYLKVIIYEKILDKKIKKGMISTPNDFRLVFGEIPKLLNYFLDFTDDESYFNFLQTIYVENAQESEEV